MKELKWNGERAFTLEESQWAAVFGDHEGAILFEKFAQERKDWEEEMTTDVSNTCLGFS